MFPKEVGIDILKALILLITYKNKNTPHSLNVSSVPNIAPALSTYIFSI